MNSNKRRPTGRRLRMIKRAGTLLALTSCLATMALAEGAVVAVASNFRTPAESLVQVFEQQTGHSVVVTSGSTGTLYAQIVNGAPFDVLLAADAERPGLLVDSGKALQENADRHVSRATAAVAAPVVIAAALVGAIAGALASFWDD